MRGAIGQTVWSFVGALVVLVSAASLPTACLAEGLLQRIRDDVRGLSSGSSSSLPREKDDDDEDYHFHLHVGDDGYQSSGYYHDGQSGRFWSFFWHGCTSPFTFPFWAPCAALDDDWNVAAYFPRFPYDHVPGYMMRDPCDCWDEDPSCAVDPLRSERWPTRPRTWAARLRMEYADEFNDVQRVSGHLLLDTRSRFGLDTETSYLEETLPDGAQDELWLGDCNVVFRFAQGEHAEFRTGLGFNWLDDPIETNFGFNFTYGADLFPRRPWVLSATIDWGTLGEAELFRFRTTGGVVLCGVEVYTGYEYLDIDAVHMNGVMGGVRIWF